MTYRSDRKITEDLMPVRLFGSVIFHGIDNPESEDAKALFGLIRSAEAEVVADLPEPKKQQILRRSFRISDALRKPFHEAGAAVSKFGLVVYYVFRHLVDAGAFQVRDGSPLDQVTEALLAEDGTLVEVASISKIDASAQKQAKRMFSSLQSEGLYRGVVWE